MCKICMSLMLRFTAVDSFVNDRDKHKAVPLQ